MTPVDDLTFCTNVIIYYVHIASARDVRDLFCFSSQLRIRNAMRMFDIQCGQVDGQESTWHNMCDP